MSDLFGNHIVGFPTRRLKYVTKEYKVQEFIIPTQTPGAEVIKLFSCSAQLRLKFILLINVKMPTIVGILTFMSRINYNIC